MAAIYLRFVRVTSTCLLLLWLSSCTSSSWPPPVAIQGREGTTAQRLGAFVETAHATANSGHLDEALAAWLAVARESSRLIEDRTACGDGTLSRIRVSQAYQHALGQVLAFSSSPTARDRLDIHIVHRGSVIQQVSPLSVKPAPSVREYAGLRVGVPVDVHFADDASGHGGRYVAVLLFPSPTRRPVLELRPTQTGGVVRLHPAGPLLPLREAAAL